MSYPGLRFPPPRARRRRAPSRPPHRSATAASTAPPHRSTTSGRAPAPTFALARSIARASYRREPVALGCLWKYASHTHRAEGCLATTRTTCFRSFFFLYFSCANAVLASNVAEPAQSRSTISSASAPLRFIRAMSSWVRACALWSLRSKIVSLLR